MRCCIVLLLERLLAISTNNLCVWRLLVYVLVVGEFSFVIRPVSCFNVLPKPSFIDFLFYILLANHWNYGRSVYRHTLLWAVLNHFGQVDYDWWIFKIKIVPESVGGMKIISRLTLSSKIWQDGKFPWICIKCFCMIKVSSYERFKVEQLQNLTMR